jgi:hypothetical protein
VNERSLEEYAKMRSFLERMVVRYPGVARRCCEVAAIWVAEEAATLNEGQSLWRSEDYILPGLARAVRESGIELAEMAREYGVDGLNCEESSRFRAWASC